MVNRTEEQLKRAEHCVCKMCGSKLEVKIVIYNKYGGSGSELYCDHCKKIEYGTEPEIYQAAKYFVDTLGFNHFTELEENERSYMLNIAKVCEILSWGSKYWGILGPSGFKIPLETNKTYED